MHGSFCQPVLAAGHSISGVLLDEVCGEVHLPSHQLVHRAHMQQACEAEELTSQRSTRGVRCPGKGIECNSTRRRSLLQQDKSLPTQHPWS